MEADGREPVWPPHASSQQHGGNNAHLHRRRRQQQDQQQPMQHDGVSSSEGDIQSPMPPPMPALSRRSDSDGDDNEPESTVPEGELLGVMSQNIHMQQAPSPLQNTDNEAMPASSSGSSILPDSRQNSIPIPIHLHILPNSNQPMLPSNNQEIVSSNQVILPNLQPVLISNQADPSNQAIVPSNQAIDPSIQAIDPIIQAIDPPNDQAMQPNNQAMQPNNQPILPSNPEMLHSNHELLHSNHAILPSNQEMDAAGNQHHPQPAEMIMDLDTGLAGPGDADLQNMEDVPGPSGVGSSRRSRPERKSTRIVTGAGDQIDNPAWGMSEPLDEEEFLKSGALMSISDKPVISRARASLPTQLQIFKVENNKVGVFAKRWIPKRTQFGPLEGKLVTKESLPVGSMKWKFQHETQGEVYLDCSDEFESNWMTFIRPASCYSEQNLIAYQLNNDIYFASIKAVEPKSELRVWYAKSYAEQLGEKIHEITLAEAAEMQDKENSWPCFECSRKFRTSELLQKHLATHDALHSQPKGDRGKRGRPRKYPEGYRQRKMAMAKLQSARKIQNKQQKQEVFSCNMCPKTFPRPYSLQRHMVMHTGEKKYSCDVCDKTFAHLYNRTRHMKRHQERGESAGSLGNMSLVKKEMADNNIFMCSDCDLEFESELLLGLHMFTHAPEIMDGAEPHEYENDEEDDDSDSLTASFAQDGDDSNSLKANVPSLLSGLNGDGGRSTRSLEQNNVDLRCPDCDELFESRKSLALHATAHGKRRSTPRNAIVPSLKYRCEDCNKPFRNKSSYDKHVELHNKEAEKPIQCEICQKRFLNNSAIACHMKIHNSTPKFYKCPFCDIGFERTELLKNHVPVHLVNGYYTCPMCSKAIMEYSQLKKHIRSFHSSREIPCPHCDRIFPRPDKLKLHMLRHSDEKNFMCENCGKQFKRKDKLKEHTIRMHNPEREARNLLLAQRPKKQPFKPRIPPTDMHAFTFKCRVCSIGFKRRGMLVNHLAKQHPEMPPETVPELNLPIVKPNRNYFCAYCEKVYKSSSKRKIHILKNHPGAALPPSLRKTKGDPNSPLGDPHTAPAGTTTTHYFACAHCPRQYSTKAKMMDHVRKKHMEPVQAAAVAASIPTVTSQAGQVTVMQDPQVQMDGVTSIVVAQVADGADGLGDGVHMVHEGQAIPISASVAAALSAAAEGNHQQQVAVPVSINAANVVHITPHMTHGSAAAAVQAIANAASAAADQNQQQHQIMIHEHRLPDGIQTAQIRYVDHTGATIQTETVQAADLLTQAMSELSQSITEFRQQPVDYQQLTQRIIQQPQNGTAILPQSISVAPQTISVAPQTISGTPQTISVAPQTISVAQIPVSGIPVSQIPVSQIPVTQIPVSQLTQTMSTITQIPVSQIPVSQIVTQVTPTTTVDVSQLAQTSTQFQQQPQLLHLQNSAQPMSPSPAVTATTTTVQQQNQQQGQQQQQIFIPRTGWANYQNNYR